MSHEFTHYSLYSDVLASQRAIEQASREPYATAWQVLKQPPEMTEALGPVLLHATQWRLNQDASAAQIVTRALSDGTGWEETGAVLAIRRLIATAHAFELVRDYDGWASAGSWLEHFAQRARHLADTEVVSSVHEAWRMALLIVAGIVLEDEALVGAGEAEFRRIVDEQIHAEGYFRSAVAQRDGQTFHRQFYTLMALVLAAEAGHQIGRNLWQYENRGVGLATAVAYMVYYYFFPEKWRWEDSMEGLHEELVHDTFRLEGAFMEITWVRVRPRSADLMLAELRPLFDPLGGGLTTLTHAEPVPEKPARWRWFGR